MQFVISAGTTSYRFSNQGQIYTPSYPSAGKHSYKSLCISVTMLFLAKIKKQYLCCK